MLIVAPIKYRTLINSVALSTRYHKGTDNYFPNTIILYEDNEMTYLSIDDFTDEFIAKLRLKYDRNYKER